MRKRKGYTDHTIAMKTMRDTMRELLKSRPTASRDELVALGVDALDAGLFEQYADQFKGYIVSNALSMAEGDERAGGRDPVRNVRVPPTPAEKLQVVKQARERLRDIAPIMFMKLPTPFGKPLGELTGREGRKLGGWMGEAFRGVKDNQTLAQSKTEAQLKQLWAT